MQAVGNPAEQLALPEYRADEHDILLVRRADPGVVGEEHVAIVNAWIATAEFQHPLNLRVGHAGHVLHVGPEVYELGVFGEDRGVEVEGIHGNRRAGDALDGRAVLFVDVPERMAHDLVSYRVDAPCDAAVQPKLRRNRQRLRWHVTHVPAVEGGAWHLAHLGHAHCANLISKLPNASTASERPGCTTTVVSVVSMTAGPCMRLPGNSNAPS